MYIAPLTLLPSIAAEITKIIQRRKNGKANV